MALRSDAVWTATDTFISAGLAFAFRLVVARTLAPDDFGVASLALTTITLLQVVGDFGLTAALIQRDENKMTPSLLGTTFTASLVICGALFLITVGAIAPLSGIYYRAPQVSDLTMVMATILLMLPFSSISTAMLYRRGRFKDVTIVRVVSNVIGLGVAAVVLFFKPDPWVIVWQTITAQLIATAGFYYMARWPLKLSFDRSLLKEVVGFSGLVFANDLAVSLSGNLAVIVIGRLLTPADVGMFALALYVTDTVRRSLMSILNRVMFVHYARSKHDLKTIRETYVKTLAWNCKLNFPVMVALIFFGHSLCVRFLGPQWQDMGPVLQWLAFSVMIHAAGGTTSTLYKAIGKPGTDLVLFLTTTVLVQIPGVIIGAHWFGLLGIAIASALTKFCSIVLRQILLDHFVGGTSKLVLKSVFSALVLQLPLVAAWLVGKLLGTSDQWGPDLVLALVGGTITMALTFYPEANRVLAKFKQKRGRVQNA